MTKSNETISDIEARIDVYERSLLDKYGVVIGGKDLRHVLGYRTADSFRKAVFRNRLPIPTFIPEGRKMRMARTRDIARWLVSIDDVIEQSNKQTEGGEP